MEGDEMRISSAVATLRATHAFLLCSGHHRRVLLQIIGTDSLDAAAQMHEAITTHVLERNLRLDWDIRGLDQLRAAADLRGPVEYARYAAHALLVRIAAGFSFGPFVALTHGAMPLPRGEGGGPGVFHFGVFDKPHTYALGHGDQRAELARAYGHGGMDATISRVLLKRFSDGLSFADEAVEVDTGGAIPLLRQAEVALLGTDCLAIRGQAFDMATHIMRVRRRVIDFGIHFQFTRYISVHRSQRRCRRPWPSQFDECVVSLQEHRISVANDLHSLGVEIQAFLSRSIAFAPPRPQLAG